MLLSIVFVQMPFLRCLGRMVVADVSWSRGAATFIRWVTSCQQALTFCSNKGALPKCSLKVQSKPH